MRIALAGLIGLALTVALVVPGNVLASGETAAINVSITPRSGPTFFSDNFKAANWPVETAVVPSGPFPAVPTITPMKVADFGFPPSSVMTFNPKPSMPVCPDSRLGPPPTSNSIPVPEMILRCPDSLIGNGTAVFAPGKSNNPLANLPH